MARAKAERDQQDGARKARRAGAPALLRQIDREAVGWLQGGHPGRLANQLDQLLAMDLSDHPWAALVVAAALHDARRGDPAVERLVNEAEAAFRRSDDERGLGYLEFMRGNMALGFGELAEAAGWWQRSRERLTSASPADEAVIGMIGLRAYEQGQLKEALLFAEEALALARLHQNRRQEGIALVWLAFFSLTLGQCSRAAGIIQAAEDVFADFIDPLDRIELPLMRAARGVLEALRGNEGAADEAFAEGLDMADDLAVPWHGAIVQTLRAELTASWQPQRSLSDGRRALKTLTEMGDAWISTWAIRASGIAAMASGDVQAAIVTLQHLTERPMKPAERARALLALGESLLLAGRADEARAALIEADQLFEAMEAQYWRAKALFLLSQADPAAGAVWLKRARALADGDPSYDHLFAGSSQLQIRLLGEYGVFVDDRRCSFRTHNAEGATYALVLAGRSGLHVDTLVDRFWPDCPPDKASGRIRTLLWQIRDGLTSAHAWRLAHDRRVVRLDLSNATVDVIELRSAAHAILRGEVGDHEQVAARLTEPLLTGWQHEDWVVDEAHQLAGLVIRLRQNL